MSDIKYQDLKKNFLGHQQKEPRFDKPSPSINFNSFENKANLSSSYPRYDELGTLKNRSNSNTKKLQEFSHHTDNLPMGSVFKNNITNEQSVETNPYYDLYPKLILAVIGGATLGYLLGSSKLTLTSLAIGGGASYMMDQQNNNTPQSDFSQRMAQLT